MNNTEEQVSALFNDWADTGRGQKMAKGHYELLLPQLDTITVTDNTSLLDIGCGIGDALKKGHERGIQHLAGIDLSDHMIDLAKQYLPEGADVVVGSAEQLPWEDHTFTNVLSIEALYYLKEPLNGLKEAFRVLQPGGHFSTAIEYYGENTGSHIWPELLPVDFTLLTETEWQQLLQEAGFENVGAKRIQRDEQPDPASFEPSKYYPTFEVYEAFIREGALWLFGDKPNR